MSVIDSANQRVLTTTHLKLLLPSGVIVKLEPTNRLMLICVERVHKPELTREYVLEHMPRIASSNIIPGGYVAVGQKFHRCETLQSICQKGRYRTKLVLYKKNYA